MSRSLQRLGKLWISWSSFAGGRPSLCHRFSSRLPPQATVLPGHSACNATSPRCYSQKSESSSLSQSQQDDRIKLFINPEVQQLLKELTERDLKRVFRKRKIGQKIKEPKYTFMTEEQLERARKEAAERADKLLQMPPVLRPRKSIDKVLSFDPILQGDERSTLIFTDITMNVSNRDRLIVARDPCGTLRHATWEERDKMNAIYFPVAGREFLTPRMFTEPGALQNVLNRASEEDNTYEFVLDRACLQFEPDEPLYISTCEATYDAVDQRGHYDFLKSTRHYGPMVFYLIRTRKVDGILLHSLMHRRISTDAVKIVSLFQIMFPECKSKMPDKNITDVDKIKRYIQLDSVKKGELELALNAYLDEEHQKAELEQGLKRQHGIQS